MLQFTFKTAFGFCLQWFSQNEDSWTSILTSSQDQEDNKFRMLICFYFCLGWPNVTTKSTEESTNVSKKKKNQNTQQNEEIMDTSWKLQCLYNLDIYNRNNSRKKAKTHAIVFTPSHEISSILQMKRS